MKRQSLVSVIIVNRNGHQWLPNCFTSLKKQTHKEREIIFVDNASTDESVLWVKEHVPQAKVIVNEENLGFAGGNNVGFKVARGEFVLFLNNDTKLTSTCIEELVNVLEKDINIGGAQSKILLMDHPDIHDSVGALMTSTGILFHFGFGKKDSAKYDKEFELYTAKGACMMFRKKVLDTVLVENSVFDPDYFAYFEESDLCHRVWLAGFRVVYAYKSVTYHKMGATSSTMNANFIQYHSYKNRIRTIIKNFDITRILTILPVHLFLCEFYALIAIFRGNFSLVLAIERALWWNIVHMRQTLNLRRIVQKRIRKVNDSKLIAKIFYNAPLNYYIGLLFGIINE